MNDVQRVQWVNDLLGDVRQFTKISEAQLFRLAYPLSDATWINAKLIECMRDVRTCPAKVEEYALALIAVARMQDNRREQIINLDAPIACQACNRECA